jgi:hypothetical protein
MFYSNSQETNSKMDIWKEENTENSSSLINNKRIAVRTRLITVFVAMVIISSILFISETQDELLAKKPTTDKSGMDAPVDQSHCDQKGYPSCYDLGYSDGQNATGTSCPSGHSEAYCNGYEAASLSGNSSSGVSTNTSSSSSPGVSTNTSSSSSPGVSTNTSSSSSPGVSANTSSSSSPGGSDTFDLKNVAGPVDQTHCDQKGYPSCYDLGYSDGQNAPGTSCPSGHSEAYCNGYEAASLSGNSSSGVSSHTPSSGGNGGSSEGNSDLKNTAGPVDQTHCDQKGYPSCYDLGYSDGQNATGTSCPSGHSEAYCNGYEAASLSGNSSSGAGLDIPLLPYHNSKTSIKQNSKVDLNQAGQSNSNINVTNSPYSNVNSRSSVSNNANEKTILNNGPFLPSASPTYRGPSSPFSYQNSKTSINQGAVNNADINVNNSSGTRITNEQIIKQSVRINNEVNNIIRNSQVNKIIRENTVSAPQQPLTDLVTVKLAKSSMSSGSLFPLADVEPYRVIGGHITANLPSSSQQNIVVAQISDGQIQHAVILDLKQIIGSNLDQNSLYETSLGSDISGTNPFTGNPDEVSSITNLFLWNNNQQTIAFDNANGVTMDLIYK